MRQVRRKTAIVLVSALVSLLAGCVDAPGDVLSPAVAADPLAEMFDAMSQASARTGDLARSDGFAFAALSVRGGVLPSRLEVKMGNEVEEYDAFVSAVVWDAALPAPQRPPSRRSLVGWRRTPAGATRVISMSVPGDSSTVLNPVTLGMGASTFAVYGGASVMQNEGRDNALGQPDLTTAWYATSGWVVLREQTVVGPCPDWSRKANELGIVRCEQVRYRLRFDVNMQRLSGRPPQLVSGSVTRPLASVTESNVNGLRLHFTCAAPSSRHGCR